MAAEQKVLVLMGGTSAEREVSLVTGAAVMTAMEGLPYQAQAFDYTGNFPDLVAAVAGQDVVFNALHGTLGEDGRIQALGDLMQVSYTHSGVAASALAMNKRLSCDVFHRYDLPLAQYQSLNAEQIGGLRDWPLALPLVVKPVAEGSSIGVHIICDQPFVEWQKALIRQAGVSELMFEEYIPGRELTVSVLEVDGQPQPLEVTELLVVQEFYDYTAKYNAVDGAQHCCPARLDSALRQELMTIATKAHLVLGLRGVSRSDFRYDPDTQRLALLETNTQPGMTGTSLLPEQARAVGYGFTQLIDHLIKAARHDG